MMWKISIRNVSAPVPSIVLVLTSIKDSFVIRRRRSGWECIEGSQWKLETGSHQKFGEPHFNATWLGTWKGCCLNFSLSGIFSYNLLVGCLVAIFYFPIYWVSNHPNWRTHIFQRGGPTTNQLYVISTGPIQVANCPWGSLIDVQRGLVQWRVELDQAKAGTKAGGFQT